MNVGFRDRVVGTEPGHEDRQCPGVFAVVGVLELFAALAGEVFGQLPACRSECGQGGAAAGELEHG